MPQSLAKSFRRFAASLITCLFFNASAQADTISVENHIAKLLDVSADHVSVIQTRHDGYRATVNVMDLMKALKIPPDRLTSPEKITFDLKTQPSGAWTINGQGSYFASSKQKKLETSIATNVERFDVSGNFDPEAGSDLMFTTNGGSMQLVNARMEQAIKFDHNSVYISERPEPSGRSTLISRATLSHMNWAFAPEKGDHGTVKADAVVLRSRASSLRLEQIKGMIRYGDRLEFHAAEGEPIFPNDTVADIKEGGVELQLSKVVIDTDKNESGGFASAIARIVGDPFTEAAPQRISVVIDDYWQKSRKEEADLDPFAPTRVILSADALDMDPRFLVLAANPSFVIGVNNNLGFIRRNPAPNGVIRLNNVRILFDNPLYTIEADGSLSYDVAKQTLTALDLSIESGDLDRVIAANAKPASRQKLNGFFQALLYFAKGASVTNAGGRSTWSLSSHDGKFTVNGRPFSLPAPLPN